MKPISITVAVVGLLALFSEGWISTTVLRAQSGDTSKPTLTVTSHPDGQMVNTEMITVAGTATDAGSGDSGISSVTVNDVPANGGTVVGAGTANWSLTITLTPGANLITVIAKDGSQNKNAAAKTFTVTLQSSDTGKPALMITSHPDGQMVNTAMITVAGTATDAGAGDNGISSVTVNDMPATGGKVAGANTANWSQAITLTPGANVVTVVAKDGSSNQNATTKTITITLQASDTDKPTLTINSHTDGQTVNTATIAVTGTATDAGAGASGIFSVTVNGMPASGGTATGSGLANWSLTVTLSQGQNLITVIAKDNSPNQNTTQKIITINYQPTPSCQAIIINLNPPALPNGTVGTAYNQIVSATGGATPYTFSVSAGALPNGLSLNPSTGAITGTPTTATLSNFTIKATDANGCMGTQQYTITINTQCPTVASINPTSGLAGSLVTITGTNFTGVTAVKFSNNITASFTVVNATTITATMPVGAVTGPITVSKTNCPDVPTTIFTVCPTITINPTNIAKGTVNAAYLQTFTQAAGVGTISFSLTGALPPGLSFQAANAMISGTPTRSGSFPITVKATDANGCMGTRNYTLMIECQPITINPATLPAGMIGSLYSQAFTQTGGVGTVTFSLTGTLPPGLSFNAATATLSGTPTQKTQPSGLPITIKATDANGCMGTRNYSVVINDKSTPVLLSVTPIGTPIVNKQFFVRIEGSGFDPNKIEVVVLGAGCPDENRCVVSNSALTVKTSTRIEAPLTLGEGTYQLHVRNGSGEPLSNCLELTLHPLVSCVSAASYRSEELAADSIVALFCRNLASEVASASSTPLPTSLLGTSVRVKDSAGVERLAELFFVSPTQVNCRLPAGTAAGMATITVLRGNDTAGIGQAQIINAAPGLFAANANGQGVAAAVVLRVKANGAQSFEPVARFDQAQGRFMPVPIDLGSSPVPDQVFLILFGTGIRGHSSLGGVTATVGGIGVPITYAGAQGRLVGLDQVNLGPLPGILNGRGNVEIVLRVDGKPANTVQVNIR